MKVAPHFYDLQDQPLNFPTHHLDVKHWEYLGRCVATFGILEEILRKAIVALTGAQTIPDDEKRSIALENWNITLREKVLGVELGGLIPEFEKSASNLTSFKLENFCDLVTDLRQAKAIRDILCHASWQIPDNLDQPLPFFVRKKDKHVNQTRMNTDYLRQVQVGTAELCCAVMSAVTSNGLHFPSTPDPTKPRL